jgi:hypothetical protein
MPGGAGGYVGAIAIRRWGDGFVLEWDIDDGVYFGFGAEAASRLFVSCSPFERGIALGLKSNAGATIWRDGAPRPGFLGLPAGAGFGVSPVIIDGTAIEAQYFAGLAAAYGADLARHVLLVYEADGPDRLSSRWILGHDAAEGTERLERLTPPE